MCQRLGQIFIVSCDFQNTITPKYSLRDWGLEGLSHFPLVTWLLCVWICSRKTFFFFSVLEEPPRRDREQRKFPCAASRKKQKHPFCSPVLHLTKGQEIYLSAESCVLIYLSGLCFLLFISFHLHMSLLSGTGLHARCKHCTKWQLPGGSRALSSRSLVLFTLNPPYGLYSSVTWPPTVCQYFQECCKLRQNEQVIVDKSPPMPEHFLENYEETSDLYGCTEWREVILLNPKIYVIPQFHVPILTFSFKPFSCENREPQALYSPGVWFIPWRKSCDPFWPPLPWRLYILLKSKRCWRTWPGFP